MSQSTLVDVCLGRLSIGVLGPVSHQPQWVRFPTPALKKLQFKIRESSAILYYIQCINSRASTGSGTGPFTGPGLRFIKISGIRVLSGPGLQYRLH